MDNIIYSLVIDELSLAGVSITLQHSEQNNPDIQKIIERMSFSFIIDGVIPRLKGLDVFLLMNRDKPIITLRTNEKGDIEASYLLPTHILEEYGEELRDRLGEIVTILVNGVDSDNIVGI